MKRSGVPDDRLRAAADYVRQGAVFADIGTDHAILPVFLCQQKRLAKAYAADVADGPVAAAREHIREAGLSDKITVIKADGLSGMDGLGLTDIALCGMGGELIAAILEKAPFLQRRGVRLILQPMTRPAFLRRYLAGVGFSVTGEKTVLAKGRLYFCLCADYTGAPYPITRLKAELGTEDAAVIAADAHFLSLFRAKRKAQEKKVLGLRRAKEPEKEAMLAGEEAYLSALCALEEEIAKGV